MQMPYPDYQKKTPAFSYLRGGGRNVRDLKEARERNAELADHFGQSTIDQSHPASKGSIHSGPITSAIIDQSHPASKDALGIDPQPGL